MEAEKCPFHDTFPEYEVVVFREELSKGYTGADGIRRTVTYPKLADHRWFCPVCRSAERKGRASAKLGSGYYSNESKEKALANWNEGVARLIPAIVKAAAKGKDA